MRARQRLWQASGKPLAEAHVLLPDAGGNARPSPSWERAHCGRGARLEFAHYQKARSKVQYRHLTQFAEDIRPLHQMCREGRVYDVESWIAEGKPLQLAPEVVRKGTRPKTALQIALETGQHSLVSLLLKNGYRLDLERYSPLDLALKLRRWD